MNSKNKGNGFERKVATLLSKRFMAHTGIPNSFRRNIDSGSFFGGKNQARTRTHDIDKASFGDLVCPAAFRYAIECKHYAEAPSFNLIMQQKITEWDTWILQAEQDCANSNKTMAIIVKYNRVPEFVILREVLADVFRLPYRDYGVISLDAFLSQPDNAFFDA